jgi:GMP synthase-like glutamine amidotransferase
MKIALVDNGSIVLEKLKALLSKNNLEFDLFDYKTISLIDESNYSYAILSGSSKLNVTWNKDVLDSESSFVLNSNLPILGICLGFQIIATCYGCNLVENLGKIKGFNKLNKME